MNVSEEKKLLRARMKSLRAALDEDTARSLGAEIETRCFSLPEYREARTVHVYVSAVNNEVCTGGLIQAMFDRGIRVIVPMCSSERCGLRHIRIESLEALKPSRFGLLEPEHIPDNEVHPRDFDIIIAPLLAFDREGGRLGFGGGYYDALFRNCACPKIGLAYSFQEVPEIPMDSHDRRLDIIVTEKETVRIR